MSGGRRGSAAAAFAGPVQTVMASEIPSRMTRELERLEVAVPKSPPQDTAIKLAKTLL